MENKIFTVESQATQDKIERAKNIGKTVEEELKSKFPHLRISFRNMQDGNKEHNIPDSYLFDIWMEPLIFKQKPTTITVLSLNEEDIKSTTLKNIEQYIDNAIDEAELELQEIYSGVKIKYLNYSNMLKGHMFEVSYPDIIPSDNISNNPATSFIVKELSKENIKMEVQTILEKYSKE